MTSISSDISIPNSPLIPESLKNSLPASFLNISSSLQETLQRIWSYQIHNYPWYWTQILIPFGCLVVGYFLVSGIVWAMEKWVSSLKEYKLQPKRVNSDQKTYEATIYLLKVYFLIILPLYATAFSFLQQLGFSADEQLPHWSVMVAQLLFFFFMEDFSHYWLHRWLHTELGYKIHRMHHEFDAPTSLATTYAHPAEIIILGLATFSGPLILRPHMFVLFIWVNLRQLAALETHCGHSLPFSIDRIRIFGKQVFGGASFHDHHHRFLDGAFASNFVWWDSICGTDKGYFEREARLQRKRARLAKEAKAKKAM